MLMCVQKGENFSLQNFNYCFWKQGKQSFAKANGKAAKGNAKKRRHHSAKQYWFDKNCIQFGAEPVVINFNIKVNLTRCLMLNSFTS